jgi:membrane protein DedA with SNARE-associated domain
MGWRLIGDNAGYAIGRMLGHKLVWRYGGKVRLTAERLHKVEVVLARYGSVAVAFARFFNVLRQLNGVVAGTVEMDWRRFLVFNALGGVFLVLIWTMAGYYLGIHGSYIAMLIHKLGLLGVAVATIMLMAIMTYIYGHKILASLRRPVADNIKER